MVISVLTGSHLLFAFTYKSTAKLVLYHNVPSTVAPTGALAPACSSNVVQLLPS